jgi:hypothetical protein
MCLIDLACKDSKHDHSLNTYTSPGLLPMNKQTNNALLIANQQIVIHYLIAPIAWFD